MTDTKALTVEMLNSVDRKANAREKLGVSSDDGSLNISIPVWLVRLMIAAAREGLEAERCRAGFAGCQLGRHANPPQAGERVHDSDCAMNSEPYMPAGPCDCGADEADFIASPSRVKKHMLHWSETIPPIEFSYLVELLAALTTQAKELEEAKEQIKRDAWVKPKLMKYRNLLAAKNAEIECLRKKLSQAAEFIRSQDHPDPTSEDGWGDPDIRDAWLTAIAAIMSDTGGES